MKYPLVSLVVNNLLSSSFTGAHIQQCLSNLPLHWTSKWGGWRKPVNLHNSELFAASGRNIACSGFVHPSLNPYASSVTDSDQISHLSHPSWWRLQGWSFAANHPADTKHLQTQRYPWASSCQSVPLLCKTFSTKRDQECSRPLNRVYFPRETFPQEAAKFFVWAISMLHSQTIPGFISSFFIRNIIPILAGMSSPLYSTEFLLICENFFWADTGELPLTIRQPSSWEILMLLGTCLASNLQRLPHAWQAQSPACTHSITHMQGPQHLKDGWRWQYKHIPSPCPLW